MKIYFIPVLLISIFSTNAQTTAIPDTQFEQILINEGIDSDGTVNGQVLTSDIVGVLSLNLHFVHDLTGLQDFAALESLKLNEGGVWANEINVDLTANTNLKNVEIWSFAGLSKLDLTGLTSLEELFLWESQGDVMTMPIDSLDFSTNTNIKKIDLGTMFFLQNINLQNGNNVNMQNFELYLSIAEMPKPGRPMCIKVDNATAAIANNAPYSTWVVDGISPTFYDTGVCTLSVKDVETTEFALYPNPATELFQINSQQEIETIHIYDLQGKLVKSFSETQENYAVADLAEGVYFVQIQTAENQKKLLKFVKK